MDLHKLLLLCYIGPGTDLVFSSLGGLLALLFSLLAFFGLLLKRIGGFFKRKIKLLLPLALLALAAAALAFLFVLPRGKKDTSMRVIVLGIDGFDPVVAESLMADGRLPHFKSLKETGGFSKLATTTPPQSPVAWASFATGTNPGKHGVFDFLERDPGSYLPDLTVMRAEAPRTLRLGSLKIPLGPSKLQSPVKAVPFWEITSRQDIPTTVLRCPLTFPPGKVRGAMLSGLGTPDLCGTLGSFSFYTTKDVPEGVVTGGRILRIAVENGRAETEIIGPRDMSSRDGGNLRIPLTVRREEGGKGVRLLVQGQDIPLQPGQWSGWVPVAFPVNFYTRAHAICRFYLKSASPDLELYLSPLNFDPAHPAFPVSYPDDFSRRLVKEVGLFHTLGQAGDTGALNEGVLSEEAALQQYYQVLDEDEAVLFHQLAAFDKGVFFFYFGITDTLQHMFYGAGGIDDRIAAVYERMDAVVGKIRKRCGDDTVLIVLSDHGFGGFSRAVHLNAWLRENGYLRLADGARSSGEFFEEVDWEGTRAYAVGLSGIYINRRGREGRGIVPAAECERLEKEIAGKLERLADPATGKKAVRKVYAAREAYAGPYAGKAPDLVVGFNPGWRASWQTALGGCPETVFEDNLKKWKGDHIFDPEAVPGVLFINRKIAVAEPRITDLAPTILKLLGVPVPADMDGSPLL